MTDHPTYLIAGATGAIGSRLCRALLEDGATVTALVRDPDAARRILGPQPVMIEVDLQRRAAEARLAEAMAGVDVAYFLVHMLGADADYARREQAAARRFAIAAKDAGVGRVIYLGGLGEDAGSPHLASRRRTAEILAELGPPLTYFRAAMVLAPDSESYLLLKSIAGRLPALPAPRWLSALTQPIGVRDVVCYLRMAPRIDAAAAREIQIGGPTVLTHLDVIDSFSREIASRPAPRVPLPDAVAAPEVLAAGAAAITKGNPVIAAELGLGLVGDTKVEDRSGADLFPIQPEPLHVAIQRALDQDGR